MPIAHKQRTRGHQADLSCEQAGGRRRTQWYDYVRPFLWYRSLCAIRAELKRWSAGESHPLEAIRWQSPWGRLISIGMSEDEIPPRTFSASSEREGGIMLEQAYAQSVLSAQALAYGIFWQGEEGWPVFWCASAEVERTIIRYEHPEWSYLECPIEIHQQEASREIALFFPEYFAHRKHLSADEQNDEYHMARLAMPLLTLLPHYDPI